MKKSFLYFVVILFLLIISVFFLTKFINLKKAYIQLFRKNAILTQYNKDGKIDGEYLSYLNGKIYVKAYFKNGERNGQDIEYFSNGKIKNERLFKMGKEVGVEKEYYENGALNYKANWQNNKHYGSQWHWNEDGTLALYNASDIQDLFFYCEYDNNEGLKKILGTVFSPNIYSVGVTQDSIIALVNHNSYHDINNLYITVATPPNLNSAIQVWIDGTLANTSRIINSTVCITDAFTKEKEINIRIEGALKDLNNRIIKKDTLNMTITKN